jgi:Do/DeqQ family serine protease
MMPRTAAAILLTVSLGLCPRAAHAQGPKEPAASPQLQASQAEARRLSDAFVNVAERVSPSVVQIDVTTRDEQADQVLRWFGRSDSAIERVTGSGVVFTPDGAILTNNHVIDNALTIGVHLRDGRFLPAKLVGRDPSTDLAVVKVEATGLAAAKFGDSEAARVGEWVVAIGSPFGLGYTVTTGVLSAKGRGGIGMNQIEDYLQTDASINPGNSGGPLCDLEGHVLGINTMVVGKGSGVGFAVPSSLARKAAEQMLKTGKVSRAWIGVGVQSLSPDVAAVMKVDLRAGALVNSVTAGGPAEKAQLRPGDIVASVAGRPVHDDRELIQEILSHEVGQNIQLEVVRSGQHYGTMVALIARPEPNIAPLPLQDQDSQQSGLGLGVRPLTPAQSAQLGLPARELTIVSTAVPGSAADRAGLRPGDVIVEADGVVFPSPKQLEQVAADGQLLLRLHRRDKDFYTALRK